jgi:hypothetical protein
MVGEASADLARALPVQAMVREREGERRSRVAAMGDRAGRHHQHCGAAAAQIASSAYGHGHRRVTGLQWSTHATLADAMAANAQRLPERAARCVTGRALRRTSVLGRRGLGEP